MPASASTRFGTDTLGIATLLKNRQLKVPVHQRSFAWKTDQVTDFWNDLRQAVDARQPEYFLGSVVLTQPGNDDRHTIIDGQQRLATTTALIASLRDLLLERGDAETAAEIERDFLASKDRRSLTSTPHLILNAEDSAFFKQVVVDRATDPPGDVPALAPSHERIVETKTFLRAQLEEHAPSSSTEARDRLLAWIEYLEKNAIVIVVDVADESDAFLIFETLNYRGVPLTVADLLKNYLFGLAGAHLEAVQRSWAAAVTTLEAFSDPDLFVTFIRHYWISENGLVRERDLFRSLKDKIQTADQALTFSTKLEKGSRNYAALLTPDHETWSELELEARADIESLVRLRIEQNRPLLLAAMDKLETSELKPLFRFLVAWSVRGLVVGGIGAGTTESAYANAAVKVRDGSVKTVGELFELVKDIVPSDDRFRSVFEGYRPPTNKIARYYLLALEKKKTGKAEPELVPNEDEEKVNLEHVFPRNAKEEDWSAFDGVDRAEWSSRLGNLALLQKSKNIRLGNKSFAVKKPKLAESELLLTKMIGESADWTPEAIVERQTQLADLAIKVWPREP
jgi:hypothetical protein